MEKDNWIDDILIRDIKVLPNKLSILGNIIYGKSGTINEWVTPLLFEISLNADWTDFIAYKCFLGIDKEEELEYVIYNKKRDEKDKYFNQHFYRPKDNWEYVFLVNKS
ncbi:hypothetical protein [Flavobacterium sp. ACN6]|uniref:hypothetical protein n=1 Tax=Flavobacterium sp. ACN6 TaxID=1920426 RepID=UPI000BB399F1|nr:hypothetical protein [Flavobacterium sp. ACN6]PBJ14600.1 hypothetical protein BSF42_10220 [Flavobacterium sp. ACN6]